MSGPYRPLTNAMLAILGELEGFTVPSWTGPALAGPATPDAVNEVLQVADRLLAADQSLIQVADAMSLNYTLHGTTATAERFMYGDEPHVEAAAAIRVVVTLVESFIQKSGLVRAVDRGILDIASLVASLAGWLPHRLARPTPPRGSGAAGATSDYSALALEDMRQFSMGWTTRQDIFRFCYRELDRFIDDVIDPHKATEEFWPMLSRIGLPYNLMVLRKLDAGNLEPFQTRFGPAWTAQMQDSLNGGRLYGIDMTIFTGLQPQQLSDGTTRFTPNTMTLLVMDQHKKLRPVAVYVADPAAPSMGTIYTPSSPAWIYSLIAVRCSLTVYGIWLGHVVPLHLVTGAMQMTMLDKLPPGHVLLQVMGPHSHSNLQFNFLLTIGFEHLAPPTSLANAGEFLTLAARYAAAHDFFANDPATALAMLGLDAADFTDGGDPADAWNLYPNVRLMLRVWRYVADYIHDVVDDLYPTDARVADDTHLAAWMEAAAAPDGGNVSGLPIVRTKAMLERVLTSLLYRIIFHGSGRLRLVAYPEAAFVPHLPPCLQSARIPPSDENMTPERLLQEFLPRVGTIGGLMRFYNTFTSTSPAVPLVPDKGPDSDLFYDERYAKANASLVKFRKQIEALVRELQPDWVEIGQWPMSIEF
ncbi:hypothetical protein JQ543_27320 [Bradyrhizobium diazoefficiens]|nr:hypothetical protein [Bradyrhizobium diazoefficiens]MBR0851483.1 hypothetical protein [Bradyrhizobium diazoefficiens]